jgi:hypothetical protein
MKTNNQEIMKYLTTTKPGLLLGLLVISACGFTAATRVFCQVKNIEQQIEAAKSVRLKVKAEGEQTSKVLLKIALENDFSQTIYLPYDRATDLWGGFDLKIYDSHEELVNPTKNAPSDRGMGSMTASEFQPSQKYELEVELQHYFELPPGKYKVSVAPTFRFIKDPTIIIKDSRPTRQSERFTVSAETTFTIKSKS